MEFEVQCDEMARAPAAAEDDDRLHNGTRNLKGCRQLDFVNFSRETKSGTVDFVDFAVFPRYFINFINYFILIFLMKFRV